MQLLCFLITGAFTSAIDGIGFKILVHLHFLNVIGPEDGIHFLERPAYLDLPTSNFSQIFEEFMTSVNADVYVYAHATAPFVSTETICELIKAVHSGEYDSAFCASKIQDFLWKDGRPLNFDAQNLPRSQDIEPI